MIKLLLIFLLANVAIRTRGTNVVKGNFQRNGENVCENTLQETKTYKESQVIHFEVSRKTKCGLFSWWNCKQQRTATKTTYHIRTKMVDVIVLHCCDGWKRRSTGGHDVCDQSYCNIGCQNGGTCLGGQHKCKCSKQWMGDLCETDVDECLHNNGNCEQVCTNIPGTFACGCTRGYTPDIQDKSRHLCKDVDECKIANPCRCANQQSLDCGSICTNTIGSYKCSCAKGYRLVGPSVCQDIDECLSKKTNNCPFKCYNRPGSYGCDCMRGFRLGNDGTTCKDINECEINNGACQHKCLNAYGTYVCQCRIGFKLHLNRRRCEDVNECQLFHGCEMQCNNTFGSYFCSCPKGYTLNADSFTCSDTNECSFRKVKILAGNISLSDCEQLCINTVGSFKCSCKRGFTLRSDGKSCGDADECAAGTHKCAHKCHNTIGSYVCSCKPGYILSPDRKNCKRLSCESIERPFHGTMNCTGLGTGHQCSFKCDPGYQRYGSKTRTCLPSSKWDGTMTTCHAKRCSELQAPENAAVLLPCHKTFRSTCHLQCMEGYSSKDHDVATCEVDKSGNVEWSVKQFKCEKIQVCDPNPCLNNGKCLIQGRDYVCDCEETGYEGPICQTGILRTPVFEKLKINKESDSLYLHAKPRNELRVTIRSTQAIVVKPRRDLRISKSSQKVQFTITPLKAGFHVISYSLSGDDAKDFKVPSNNTVYVEIRRNMDSVYTKLKIEKGLLPVGCHDHSLPDKILQCKHGKGHLVSTNLWSPNSQEIVHIKTGNATTPISLFGTNELAIPPTRKEVLEKIKKIPAQSMTSSIYDINKNGKCEIFPIRSDDLLEFIQTDAFPRAFLISLSRLMPKWIRFNIDKNNNLFDISNLIVSIGRPPSHGQGSCEDVPLPFSGKVFFKPAISFQTNIDGEEKAFGANEQACFAIDMCNHTAFVAFSPKARKKFLQMKILRNMKNTGWDFQVSSLGLRKQTLVEAKEHSFDMWIKGKAHIDLTDPGLSVKVNMSGDFATNSKDFEELFTQQFTNPISGEVKGKMSIKTTMQLQKSGKTSLKFKSDHVNGKFTFGGDGDSLNRLPIECGTSQGTHITLKSKDNPFQGSVLSSFILPYLQNAMNVSIYHKVEGGGQSGVRIPADLQMKLMILGFVVSPLKFTLQSIAFSVPQLKTEGSDLLKMVNQLNTMVTGTSKTVKANPQSTLIGEKANKLKNSITSLETQIASVLTSSTKLSKKLLQYKANIQVPALIAGIKSFKDNIQAVKSLKLDVMRSPVKQDLKGLVVDILAQLCLGQLCIPDVKSSLLAVDDDTNNSAILKCLSAKNINSQHIKKQQFPLVIASPSKKLKLGNIFSIEKDQPIIFSFSQPLLQMNSTINLFGISKQVTLNVSNLQLNTKVKGKIFKEFKCSINITAETSNVVGWEALVYKVRGEMEKKSTLTRMLQNSLNNYALTLVKRSEKRSEKAKLGFTNATMRVQNARKALNVSRVTLKSLERNQTLLKKLLKRKRGFYAIVVAWFDDALYNYNLTSYEKKRCDLTDCNRICNKTCVQDVCQYKANIAYTKKDCSYVNSYITRLIPRINSTTMTYTTTPQIRKDVGKCKSAVTAFFESFLTFGLYSGKRRKRSLTHSEKRANEQKLKTVLSVNEYLQSSNLTLKRDFDINIELRKRLSQLPKNFDLNRALEAYIMEQYRFDVNIILKEQFPALSSTFDINKELSMAVPELKTTFSFDDILRRTVLKAVRLKSPVNFIEELRSISPELQTNLDSVLKRSLPQLTRLDNITRIIQNYLDDVVTFSMSPEILQTFDVNSIIKTKFRGLHRNVDVNALIQQQVPQLGPKFNINKLIINAILGIGPKVGKLDEMIANVSGVQGFSLQKMLSKTLVGFEDRLNFEELIKNKLKDMMVVNVNDTILKTLTFSNIIKHNLPKFKGVDVDQILISAFPSLANKLNVREILQGAAPLMKVLGDLDLNQVIMGVFKNTRNLNLDRLLKTRNPALRGQTNIERYLSKRLKNVILPNFDNIVMKATPGFPKISWLNIDSVLENIIGKSGIEDLRNLVQTSVFSGFPKNDVFDNGASLKKGHKNRVRRWLGNLAFGVLTYNVKRGIQNAKKNSGCTHIYQTTSGKTETHHYEFKKAVLKSENIAIQKWKCSKTSSLVNITTKGYGPPEICCRKDIPCVEFLDPVCVKKNEECFNERKEEFKQYQSSFNVSLFEQYRKLVSSEKEVSDVAMQLEEVRLRKEVALQNNDIIQARVNQLLAMENTSRIIYQKVKNIPQVKLGLKVKNILKDSFDERPLRVSELSFNTISSSLSKPRLPFKATIKTRHRRDLILNFILDFENIKSSVTYATEKAIVHLITPSRKRRSASNYIRAPNQNYDSCLLFKNASLYFSDILTSLRVMIASYGEQRNRIHNEMHALDDLRRNLDRSSGSQENSIAKGYSQVLSIYKEDRRHQTDMMSWNESLVTWKNFVENVTEIRQPPNCSGALDCIEELSEILSENFKALGNRDKTVNILNIFLNLTSGIKDLLVDDELPENQLKPKLRTLFLMLNKTQDKKLLCMDKPKMMVNANKEVRLLTGENITLHCRASSQTEILYTWRRNNDLLQTSKDGILDLLDLQDTNQGLYRCEARNHKGSTFSGITTIKVESTPQILEHPVSSHVPLNKKSIVKLSCVASGKPTPAITWLYRPPSSNISIVLADENTNLLSVVPDDKKKSGYYYCEARNARGLSVSREARLDVLTVTAANPKMAIVFNVTSSCEAEACQANQAVPSQMDATLKQNINDMIIKSLGLSSRRISRLGYMRLSKSMAQIFLFISTPLLNSPKDLSTTQIMERFSEARVNLVGKLKRLIYAMNKTTLLTGNPSSRFVGLVETLGFLHVEPDCPPGQWLHNEGYFCVKCPPGSYKEGIQGTCQRCPVGTYQQRAGQSVCIPCGLVKTTLRQGTIDGTSCIMKASCTPGSFATKEDTCLVCPPKTYQPLAGKTACIPCTTGPELKEGQTTCESQGPGKPRSLMVFTISSSSIKVLWWKPKTGDVNHYELEYGFPGKSASSVIQIYPMTQSYHSGMQHILRGLKKFTVYRLKVYAVFDNQRGEPAIYQFRTQGDVPGASPKITSALAVNSTAVKVNWQELPVRSRNGFILSYTVFFKENAHAVFNKKKVGRKQLSTFLTGLKQDTRYCIKMTTSTQKGAFRYWNDNPCYWVKTLKLIM